MHILAPDQDSLQSVRFAPRSVGYLQYYIQLYHEQTSLAYQLIGYGIQSGSYITILRQWPVPISNEWYYMRVFTIPAGPLSPDMAFIDSNDPSPGGAYISKTKSEIDALLTGYIADDIVTAEVYRGKIFVTDQTDYMKYTMYDPAFDTAPQNNRSWVVPS